MFLFKIYEFYIFELNMNMIMIWYFPVLCM